MPKVSQDSPRLVYRIPIIQQTAGLPKLTTKNLEAVKKRESRLRSIQLIAKAKESADYDSNLIMRMKGLI